MGDNPILSYETQPRRELTTCMFCGRTNRDTGPQVEWSNRRFQCAKCVDAATEIVRQGRESGIIPVRDNS